MSRHLLVIEDDRDIRETLVEVLESVGFTVSQAEDGRAGLELLRTMAALPDLILLDLMMPIMDGYEFRSVQRADARLSSIPVVIMSADPQLDRQNDVLSARRYVRKPFDVAQILAATAV